MSQNQLLKLQFSVFINERTSVLEIPVLTIVYQIFGAQKKDSL